MPEMKVTVEVGDQKMVAKCRPIASDRSVGIWFSDVEDVEIEGIDVEKALNEQQLESFEEGLAKLLHVFDKLYGD